MAFLARGMDGRGGDSFGVAKLNSRNEIKLWKGLGRATGNIYLPSVAQASQLMLHTRKRTHGAISLENAHPIRHGHIIGCHNGIVSNHHELNRKYERAFELDSCQIFEHMSKGLDVGEIDVYGAISYLDVNDPTTLNLCKLSVHGDLEVYGIGSDKTHTRGIVYASTKEPIEAALTALREKFFHFDDLMDKRRYYIREGTLYIDNSKSGKLPFGSKAVHTYYTGGMYMRKGDGALSSGSKSTESWIPPDGFIACKPCRKRLNKKRLFTGPSSLCTPCWNRYLKVRDIKTDIVGSSTSVDKPKLVEEDMMCSMRCGRLACFEQRKVFYCTTCWEQCMGSNKKIKIYPELVKPGENIEDQEGGETEKELIASIAGSFGDNSLSIPLELEQWDLCHWCASEVRTKRKFRVSELCPGCTAKWDAMITDIKTMTKEERVQFNQVLVCSECRVVPTFGWSYKDAFLSDGKQRAKCSECFGRCRTCGTKNPKMMFAATKDGTILPYCSTCFAKRRFVNREAPEEEEKEKEDAVGC